MNCDDRGTEHIGSEVRIIEPQIETIPTAAGIGPIADTHYALIGEDQQLSAGE